MSEIIQVRHFSLSIKSSSGEKLILQDLTLDIEQGEILGLIGSSGSGKSLFGLSIADLLYLIETTVKGQINYYDGVEFKNIFELPTKELNEYRRAYVSFIFQDPLSSLNPAKSCGWQINESIRYARPELSKKKRLDLAFQTIKEVELEDVDRIYNSYPHQLSGGQLQRIMIAMAIVGRAKLIVADEPTSSLDNETENKIIDLLYKLQSRLKFSLLFISHDIQLVKSFCDRIAIMDEGKLLEIQATSDFFSNPKTQIAKELLAKRLLRPVKKKVGVNQEVFLQVNKLCHFYKQRKSLFSKPKKIQSLYNVSFTICRSEILGLMGQSGSGKSTIAKILTGFETPSKGGILIDDLDLVDLWKKSPKRLRKRIQIIFQNPFSSLNPLQIVHKSISEVLTLHQGLTKAQAKEETKNLLQTVGLTEDYLDRYPSQMSGGEQQRVSMARALAVKPELLICDECVSALDASTKSDLLDLLRSLRDEEGLTLLFVSHDEAAINYLCDRIIYLDDGEIKISQSQVDSHSKTL